MSLLRQGVIKQHKPNLPKLFRGMHPRILMTVSEYKQSGVPLHHVILPTWAKGDPR